MLLYLLVDIFIVVTAQDVLVTELSRSFSFAAVTNTSSILDSDDQIIATHTARSAVHCAHKCLTKKECRVIGFNAESGVCWLMKSASRNGVLKSQENMILKKVTFDKLPEKEAEVFSSCKEAVVKGRSKGNGIYNINTNQTSIIKAYCHMDQLPVCGGGGWTLTMKIDGSKNTFNYDSSYWTNKQALETENGLGLEKEESKLPTYWSTPLTKICLGMKKTDMTSMQWIKLRLKQPAASLLDVITTGYPAEPYNLLGVRNWRDRVLTPAGYTIYYYPREGVSVQSSDSRGSVKVRLGVLYQDGHLRWTYLGFGTWGSWHQKYGVMSCGCGKNVWNNNIVRLPAFCYILVQ